MDLDVDVMAVAIDIILTNKRVSKHVNHRERDRERERERERERQAKRTNNRGVKIVNGINYVLLSTLTVLAIASTGLVSKIAAVPAVLGMESVAAIIELLRIAGKQPPKRFH